MRVVKYTHDQLTWMKKKPSIKQTNKQKDKTNLRYCFGQVFTTKSNTDYYIWSLLE